MAVKYMCPKCGRKFTEVGAGKLGFRCPADRWSAHPDTEIELVRVGQADEKHTRRTSPKRTPTPTKAKKTPEAAADTDLDEALMPDIEEMENSDESEEDDAASPHHDDNDDDEGEEDLENADGFSTVSADDEGSDTSETVLGSPAFDGGDDDYGASDW